MALSLALLEELVSDIEGISRKNGHRLDLLEDRVLDDETDGLAGELGSIRRLAITLRRRVLPLRQLVNKLADVLPPWVGAAERQRLDPLVGRVDRAGGEILESQEQARLLQDEIAARAAERNGRNIYILSVLTVFFLPLNLITGFFGMNVGGMPGVGSDVGTLWVTVGMVVIGVLSLWIFRRMRWL
jgi:zinc transporter